MASRRSASVSDTSPDAEDVLLQLLREAPPWRKLEVVSDLNRTLREIVCNELAERNPGKSDEELRYLLAERLYGAEVAHAIEKACRGR
jgi:hypothetical protein